MIVSMPVDLSDDSELSKFEEKAVKGRYVSAELLKELPNGKVEWRMATSSRAEGSLPQFLTERAMPSSISHVCLSFIFPDLRLIADYDPGTVSGRTGSLEVPPFTPVRTAEGEQETS